MISSFMEKILISACLIGDKTKYDGTDNKVEELLGLLEFFELVPFCPEMEGGLPVPRNPSEKRSSGVFSSTGEDVTPQFNAGASKALRACQFFGIRLAILKERSPSCGVHEIYDGHFSGKAILGEGVTAQMLRSHGIKVLNEVEAIEFLKKKIASAADHEEYLRRREEEARQEEEKKARLREKKPSSPHKGYSKKPFPKKKGNFGKKPYHKPS